MKSFNPHDVTSTEGFIAGVKFSLVGHPDKIYAIVNFIRKIGDHVDEAQLRRTDSIEYQFFFKQTKQSKL